MLTLGEFLNSNQLKWYKVLSGIDFNSRVVEHIAVIEFPVENFVRPNEIVLSSASGCVDDDKKMFELVSQICELGACALILARPNDALTLPANCMAYLKKKNFPVILIPWSCLFADLTEFVVERIQNDSLQEIRLYERIQRDLLSAYLNGENLNSAAKAIATAFQVGVALFDSTGNLKGSFGKVIPADLFHPDISEDSLIISTGEQVYGYMLMTEPSIISLPLFEQYLLQPMILWFDRELVEKYAKQKEKDDFIWELIKGTAGEQQDLLRKGMLLGFDLQKPYACVVGQVHIEPNYSEKYLDVNILAIKEQMIEIAKSLHRALLLTFQKCQLIFYIEGRAQGDEFCVNQYLDRLEERISVTFPHLRFSWGICSAHADPSVFRESYLRAKLAHDMCSTTIGKNIRYSYKNTIVTQLLSRVSDDLDIRRSVLQTIQSILEYDRQNHADFMLTLQTYLKLKNVSETARTLHLHRQSLIYRLGKIEELTGMSLKDDDNWFLLEIAVRMFSMTGE